MGLPVTVADSVRSQLERILHSESFRNTQNLRVLLAYLAEKSLDGKAQELKEYTVGVEAFGKPADYNPQLDASVRVQTGKLRQRLEEYYRIEGVNDAVHIELPKGHFSLKFSTRSLPSALGSRELRRWQRLCIGLLAVVALVLAAAVYWRVALSRARTETAWVREQWTPELEEIWRPYLESNRPTMISLGTPLFVKFRRVYFRSPDLNRWEEITQDPIVRALRKLGPDSEPLPSQIYTGIGEASGVFLLSRLLFSRKRDLVLKRSSVLAWEDIRQNDMIFVGSPKYNPQLAGLPLDQDLVIQDGAIRNRHPRPGESATYGNQMAPGAASSEEDHALITRLPGIHGRGEITVLAANSTQGTWAAVEYVTEDEHARELVRSVRLPSGKLPRAFQVVIRARFKNEVPVQLSYVTHHVLAE
jgi:hypothetical protein